ncbi:MAG: DUF6295 family protein [Acidimicrobiales bacterium]
MCTYLTATEPVSGAGLGATGWFRLDQAVVYFDHPQQASAEHALCIDFRAGKGADPGRRVSVELDAASAKRLAETILSTLDSDEVKALEPQF